MKLHISESISAQIPGVSLLLAALRQNLHRINAMAGPLEASGGPILSKRVSIALRQAPGSPAIQGLHDTDPGEYVEQVQSIAYRSK